MLFFIYRRMVSKVGRYIETDMCSCKLLRTGAVGSFIEETQRKHLLVCIFHLFSCVNLYGAC